MNIHGDYIGMSTMTLTEAARMLGLSAETLRWQVHKKKLRAHKMGNLWIVTFDEVERYRRENLRAAHAS